MTDESRLGRAGTGVAKTDGARTIRPDRMILGRQIAPAPYTLSLDATADDELAEGTGIPLPVWLERHASGRLGASIGVIARGADDLTPLRAILADVPFVAIHFPIFSDGRGYSHAFRLRKTWSYRGPIVAFGDVLRDQLLYMSRVGIDGFYLRADQDLEASLGAFGLYSSFYQYDDVASS